MASLTDQELAEIQTHIDGTIEYLDGLGLEIDVDDDLSNWKRLLEQAPGSIGVSRTLDPTVNDLRPGNSFWVYTRTHDGEVVACQADRLIVTENFVRDDICTHRLFGDRRPIINFYPIELGKNLPFLTGRVTFGGGTWVHPDWRGHGLGGFMSRLGRALSIRHFLADYFVTFMKTGRKFSKECGFDNRCQLCEGYYPGRDSELDMDLFWETKDEFLERMRKEQIQDSSKAAA